MMIIDRIHLVKLFDHIHDFSVESALSLWRQIMNDATPHCQDCTFERMMGRRCCCMCLESSLSNTSLRLHLNDHDDQHIRTTLISVKSHREQGCDLCVRDTKN